MDPYHRPTAAQQKTQRNSSSVNKLRVTHTAIPRVQNQNAHPHDVLLGRGKAAASWPGNQRYQALIKHSVRAYEHASKNAAKLALTRRIVASVTSEGGRFLKLTPHETWVPISLATARVKLAQALRHWRRRNNGGNNKDEEEEVALPEQNEEASLSSNSSKKTLAQKKEDVRVSSSRSIAKPRTTTQEEEVTTKKTMMSMMQQPAAASSPSFVPISSWNNNINHQEHLTASPSIVSLGSTSHSSNSSNHQENSMWKNNKTHPEAPALPMAPPSVSPIPSSTTLPHCGAATAVTNVTPSLVAAQLPAQHQQQEDEDDDSSEKEFMELVNALEQEVVDEEEPHTTTTTHDDDDGLGAFVDPTFSPLDAPDIPMDQIRSVVPLDPYCGDGESSSVLIKKDPYPQEHNSNKASSKKKKKSVKKKKHTTKSTRSSRKNQQQGATTRSGGAMTTTPIAFPALQQHQQQLPMVKTMGVVGGFDGTTQSLYQHMMHAAFHAANMAMQSMHGQQQQQQQQQPQQPHY